MTEPYTPRKQDLHWKGMYKKKNFGGLTLVIIVNAIYRK
jgi:hypothetical protein